MVYEPYLYLTKVHYDAQAGREEKDITVAALDGSWCRSGYSKVFGVSEGLLVACTADAQVEAIDGATGKLIRRNCTCLSMLRIMGRTSISAAAC